MHALGRFHIELVAPGGGPGGGAMGGFQMDEPWLVGNMVAVGWHS